MPAWLDEAWDRMVASDPGLARLRMALGGAGSMATALAVEYGAATLLGAQGMQRLIFLLMGGIVAMMGSMALSGLAPGVWTKVRTAVFFPVAFGTGITIGILVHGTSDLVMGVFVAMTFLAVFIRRFGIPFFFYGFMAWIGYLFASLLGATFTMLPAMLIALAVGTAWVLLLSLTVLGTNTTRTLTRTLRAFHARVRTVAAICADLADIDAHDEREFSRWRNRLHRHQSRLTEAALMVEASSGEHEALPDAEAGQRLRNYALDAQLAIDALAGAIETIASTDPDRAGQAAEVARRLARHDVAGAQAAAAELQHTVRAVAAGGSGDWWPTYRLVEAVSEFVTLAAQVPEFSPAGLSRPEQNSGEHGTDDGEQSFRPAVGLMMGNLPSSVALARDVPPRGPRWLLSRLSMTTRQAIQVALASGLAILAGHALSGHRYYWALIAVFVTFTGTATRAESVRKALYRLLGTLIGLVVAMLLAHVTAGNSALVLVVIVTSLFCGFYLMRISYAFMIFFITIMVAELYSVLGEYSNGLLVLRLEETAIGAASGIAVALVFLPLSTRDTVRAARDSVLNTLAHALTTVADRIDRPAPVAAGTAATTNTSRQTTADDTHAHSTDTDGTATDSDGNDSEQDEEEPPGLEELARQLDDGVRQLATVATPFSRPAMWGNNGRHIRYRLTRFAALAGAIRAISVSLRRTTISDEPALAEICRSLATTATSLTTHANPAHADSGSTASAGPDPTQPGQDHIAQRLDMRLPDAGPPRHYALTRSLMRINELLGEIAPPTPAGATGAASHVPAQSTLGGLRTEAAVTGRVTDTAGAGLPAATVTLLDGAGHRVGSVNCDATGDYRLPLPGTGPYLALASCRSHQAAAAHLALTAAQPSGDPLLLCNSELGLALQQLRPGSDGDGASEGVWNAELRAYTTPVQR